MNIVANIFDTIFMKLHCYEYCREYFRDTVLTKALFPTDLFINSIHPVYSNKILNFMSIFEFA
jgi:hypothetical protein